MLAGQPGGGKSAFALATAVRTGVPTLIFSADTAAWTAGVRLAAMLTGGTQEICEESMKRDPAWAAEVLAPARHIRWCFDAAPTLDVIDLELLAYEEVFGKPPALIIVDNLIDVSDGDEEFAALRRTSKELKFLARDTGAAVLALHHTLEGHGSNDGAPGRRELMGKDSRMPALVLTIGRVEEIYLAVAVVKNRYGPFDPSGKDQDFFYFDGARMAVTDVMEMQR